MVKIAILIFSALLITACSSSSGPDGTTEMPISNRAEAAAFSSTTVQGETYSLTDLKGKVVYLFFLGSFCPVCKVDAPKTVTVDNKYNPSEVQVLGLDVWDGSAGQVLEFITSTGVQYPVLQNMAKYQNAYSVSYDYSVVIDKQGRIAYRKKGVNTQEINSVIDMLLKE